MNTLEVGSYPLGASPYGAMDMAGNVAEWVADWWGEYPTELQVNPTGPLEGVHRVIRGGGYSDFAQFIRTSLRYKVYSLNATAGFRCVQSE